MHASIPRLYPVLLRGGQVNGENSQLPLGNLRPGIPATHVARQREPRGRKLEWRCELGKPGQHLRRHGLRVERSGGAETWAGGATV